MPQIHETCWLAPGAWVVGNATLGPECSVWYNAVIRADDGPITIGPRTNVQDCVVIHVSRDHPTVLGEGVTVGNGAIVHGCTIGANTLIGMGAVVMDGAVVGRDCVIGAGSLVTQSTVIPDGSLAFGSPARLVRALDRDAIEANRETADAYVAHAREHRSSAFDNHE